MAYKESYCSALRTPLWFRFFFLLFVAHYMCHWFHFTNSEYMRWSLCCLNSIVDLPSPLESFSAQHKQIATKKQSQFSCFVSHKTHIQIKQCRSVAFTVSSVLVLSDFDCVVLWCVFMFVVVLLHFSSSKNWADICSLCVRFYSFFFSRSPISLQRATRWRGCASFQIICCVYFFFLLLPLFSFWNSFPLWL